MKTMLWFTILLCLFYSGKQIFMAFQSEIVTAQYLELHITSQVSPRAYWIKEEMPEEHGLS